ncbi:hypothetical protein GALMADRAFT_112175 [Galerina marginata CBS 339.88]|uniref:Cytochrome c oxidase assembly protein COX20, mitochondrial n=1 Tax=Galerina marginata (strain CBS 339.88) TaxID=685588 RepID=A0A067TRI0_GALM3|nr:hypothetical protein GALMADRAFT_112175 [Galerina marginata CBS 339.88]
MFSNTPTSQPPTLPSKVPSPTGNLLQDSLESAKHVSDLPCARNALLAGIASGTGMGVIRGMTAGPMMAGHWAIGTFVLISLGSWHICQKQYTDERRKITQVIESMPKRTLKEGDSRPTNGAGAKS